VTHVADNDLRPYQRDTIARVQAAYREGARSVLMQLPTGGGKTHCAARGVIAPSVARGRRVAFVADLEEIVDDTAERLRAMGLVVGTVKAGRAGDAQAPVQVCSLQTLARRMDALPDAERVIIDEALGRAIRSQPTSALDAAAITARRLATIIALYAGRAVWIFSHGPAQTAIVVIVLDA
jgi:hypothetical protein